MLEKEEQLKTMQEMNEDRLQAQKDILHERLEFIKSINQNQKSANTRQYSKEELNSIFDDINNAII